MIVGRTMMARVSPPERTDHPHLRMLTKKMKPKSPKMIGVADARDGMFVEYRAPFSDGHTNASHHGNLFVGDGSDKEPFINLYELKDGKLTGRHIFRHGSSFAQQHWHPHPAFSPEDKFVLFTSKRAGAGDVYLIRIAR